MSDRLPAWELPTKVPEYLDTVVGKYSTQKFKRPFYKKHAPIGIYREFPVVMTSVYQIAHECSLAK